MTANIDLKEISFEILQRCINNCIYCSSNSSNDSKSMIEFSVFQNVIEDAVSLGLERVCFSGGEPFLHPDLHRMISYAKSKNIEVYVYTSGIKESNGIKSSLDHTMLNDLKDKNLDRLIFNMQAPEAKLYDKIMGTSGCFDLLVGSIKNSINTGIYTEVHFVPMKINYERISDTIKLLKDLQVNQISFLRLVLQGRALKNRELVQLSDSELEALTDSLSALKSNEKELKIRIGVPLSGKQEQIKCNAGSGKLIIRYDGAVYPCEAYKYIECITNGRIYPDNINTKSVKEIWYHSPFLSVLREKITSFHNQDLCCEVCPAQMLLKERID
ncbi:MAG: radical SAM protein [Bacteroidota bacterium]